MSSNRKKRAIVLSALGFITLVSFQNCKQLKSDDLASTEVKSNADSSGGASAGDSATRSTTAGTDNGNAALEEKIKDCMQYIVKPSVKSLSTNEVTLGSGLGPNSGDVTTPDITVTVQAGISDVSAAAAKTCPITTTVRFDIIDATDAMYAPSIITARNIAGDEVVMGSTDEIKTKSTMWASKAITRRGDGDLIDVQTGQVKISVANNRNTRDSSRLRCVEGVAYFAVISRTEIGNQNLGKIEVSDRQILKLNYKNNCWNENRLTTPTVLGRGIQYGSMVAIEGNTVVSVSPIENNADNSILGLGSAYVYEQNSPPSGVWNFQSKLVPNNSVANENISSIAMAGGRIYLGSKYYKNGLGVVYIYEKNQQGQWMLLPSKLESPTQVANQGFAHSIKVKNGFVFVGAPDVSTAGTSNRSGLVFVYQLVNGSYNLIQTLSPNGDIDGKGFGAAIDFDGSQLVIGAPMATNWESSGTGEVQIFNLQAGQFQYVKTLKPDGNMAVKAQKFGLSVAVNGKAVLVGAPWYTNEIDNPDKAKMGAAYYFADYTTTTSPIVLTTTGAGFSFGQTVAINSSGILIGVPGRDAFSGSVEFYKTADVMAKKLSYRHQASNTVASDKFGVALAVDGLNVVVGAATKASPNTSAGAVYIHRIK